MTGTPDESKSGPYEPTIDTAVWLAVRDFVTEAVDDAVGKVPYREATLNAATTRLVAWCWQTAGLPLDRGVVFNRDTIARFIAVGCGAWKPAARGNLRSQLLRMSEVLLGRSASLRRLGALPPSDPAQPYSRTELIRLRSWASSQSTPFRRTNAAVLLSLGAGAGLSASEIGELRVGDIHVSDAGVTIGVTGVRARRVPVRRVWEGPLVDRVRTTAAESYAFRENHTANYPNLISSFVVRSGTMQVRPTSQRLRSTWIVHHLSACVPVVTLMRAAGVDSLEAFTRYVRFIPPTGEADTDAELRS
jgi:integrase